MSNHLTFTTTLDCDTLTPVDYTVEGTLTIDGEETPIALSSANFDRVFEELSYWTRHASKDCEVTFKTKDYNAKQCTI